MLQTADTDPIQIDRRTFSVRVTGTSVALTPYQFDLLTYLASHRDRVVGHVEIANAVFGAHNGDVALLVRVHICHLRKALGHGGRLIVTMRGRGYRLLTSREAQAWVE
jgi:DNA-binding response OmpR family regulator